MCVLCVCAHACVGVYMCVYWVHVYIHVCAVCILCAFMCAYHVHVYVCTCI